MRSFLQKTVLEAILEEDSERYIYQVSEKLHLLPSDDLLGTLSRRLEEKHPGNRVDQLKALKRTLEPVRHDYDFILLDLPPSATGDETLSGLTASDYVVVVVQTEPLAFNAVDRFIETLELVQEESNPDLTLLGFLTTMVDSRKALDVAIREQLINDYEGLVFDVLIKERARITEFTIEGITDAKQADRDALKQYDLFKKELLARVEAG